MAPKLTAREVLADPRVRGEVDAHAMRWFPKECCGLLVLRDGVPAAVCVANELDRAHAEDPERFPRTGETGYLLDGRLLEDAPSRGEEVVAIFHSHVRVGAYFSAEDRAQATAPWGDPLYPGVEYVVLDVQEDGVRGFAVFAWDEAKGEFAAS